MFNRFGLNRVLEPKHVLSTSAWKVDNNREVHPNELRVSLKKLHIENTSFKQICIEADNNPQKIKDRIMDIVIRRGKMHNPVTDTGGVVYGVVEEIGSEYVNKKGLQVGDEVICNASAAAIPLYISRITKIDMAYSQVDAEGYAILFNEFPVVKPPEGVPVNLLLYAYDESGTLYAVNQEAKGKTHFLVVGNNLL
nr:L-erythro-3,5-diaminohexanoate dehydrogenase [Bacillota bacterium]